MGKILACCLISLACLISTGLAETQKESRLSNFLSRSKVPAELEKYAELWERNIIVYFGADWCTFCPTQKAILKALEKKGYRVEYFDSEKDLDLYNYMRGTKRGIPLTVIFIDGKIKKRYIGVRIIHAEECKKDCDTDCDCHKTYLRRL